MKKTSLRFFLLLMVLVLLGTTACASVQPIPAETPLPVTSAPTQTPEPTEAPTPTPAPTPAPGELLAALDYDMLQSYVTEDLLSYNLLIAHPENFEGLEKPTSGWGDFSAQGAAASFEEYKEFAARLAEIDRSVLTESEQLTYDTLKQYLDASLASEEYYYYQEPLTSLSGMHSNLPINLILMDLKTAEDVEDYLFLLEDMPRLLDELLLFEQEKAAKGLFMRKTACDEVLSQLKEFVSAGEDCFLYEYFEDTIEELEGLTADQKTAYLQRNSAGVTAVLAAYQKLIDGLTVLNDGSQTAGLYELPNGREYFALGLKDATCSDMTPEEMVALLSAIADGELSYVYEAMQADPSLAEKYGTVRLSRGSLEEDIAHLKTLMNYNYPLLPFHRYEFIDIPDELEEQFSPAAYLIPPIDDATENKVIINSDKLEEYNDLLSLLAHECYPGHMYQYVYQRNLTDTGYMRNVLSLTAYYEAWSTWAEGYFAMATTQFDNNYCMMMNADSMYSNILLPAIVSIYVNYEGWTQENVELFLAQLFGEDTAKLMSPAYYDIAVDNPFYYLTYAAGYAQLQDLILKYSDLLGEDFDFTVFHTTYLDLGPSYFNLIEARMDAWAETITTEAVEEDPAA